MSAVAFEISETFLIADDRQTKLVIVKELLDELRDAKKRIVDLETWREKHSYNSEVGRRRAAGSAARASELETGPEPIAGVGNGERADSLLADGGEDDFLAEQERDSDVAVVHEILASAREHELFGVTGDCT